MEKNLGVLLVVLGCVVLCWARLTKEHTHNTVTLIIMCFDLVVMVLRYGKRTRKAGDVEHWSGSDGLSLCLCNCSCAFVEFSRPLAV